MNVQLQKAFIIIISLGFMIFVNFFHSANVTEPAASASTASASHLRQAPANLKKSKLKNSDDESPELHQKQSVSDENIGFQAQILEQMQVLRQTFNQAIFSESTTSDVTQSDQKTKPDASKLNNLQPQNQKSANAAAIPKECACVDSVTGDVYDFCFREKNDTKNVGLKMDCANLKYLKKLDLFDETSAKRVPLKMTSNMTIVTAASDNHMPELREMIGLSLVKYPSAQMIFYDLGMNPSHIDEIKSFCNVQYRTLPFSDYPGYVKNLYQYRWKPIIIAKSLSEFPDGFWWMDAHIRWQDKPLDPLLKAAIEERNNHVTFNFWMFISVYSTTHPDMYKYFPTNLETLKRIGSWGANHMYYIRTEVTLRVMRWVLLCALEQGCMGPPKSQIYCHFGKDLMAGFGNCHRFDQSAINLMLMHEYDMDPSKYGYITNLTLAEKDHLNYVRSKRGGPAPKKCATPDTSKRIENATLPTVRNSNITE